MKKNSSNRNFFFSKGLQLYLLVFIFFNLTFLIRPIEVFSAGLNGACTATSDCDSGLYCDTVNGSSCQPIGTGVACSSNNDCDASNTKRLCLANKCTSSQDPNKYPTPTNGVPTSPSGSCGQYNTTDIVKQIQGVVGTNPDGKCDAKTVAALQIWQQNHGLTNDGIVGSNTIAAMGLASNSSGPSTGGSDPTTGSNSDASVKCPAGLKAFNGICLPEKNNFNTGLAGSNTLWELLTKIIEGLLTFAGIIAVGALVVGGFWYITSAGNEEQSEKGRKIIINAIIGLVIIILSYTIVAILSATLTGADKLITK